MSLSHLTPTPVPVFPRAREPRREDRAGCPKFPIQLNFREGYPRSYSQPFRVLMLQPFSFHPLSVQNPSLTTFPLCIIGFAVPTSSKTLGSTMRRNTNRTVVVQHLHYLLAELLLLRVNGDPYTAVLLSTYIATNCRSNFISYENYFLLFCGSGLHNS